MSALLCMPLPSVAGELIVILDHPNAQPISDFLGPAYLGKTTRHSAAVAPESVLGVADVSALLPIRSPGLTPGAVQARSHSHPFMQPFFLIGSDTRSRQWLVRHRDTLKALGALGMLVEADDIEDLEAIASLAEGLPITPASATDIAQALGISHYPVCITAKRIWQ